MYNGSGYAFDNECAILNIQTSQNGLYIFDGGAEIQGTTSTDAYWPPGDYVFTVYSGGTTGAYNADQGNTIFGAVDAAGDCSSTSSPTPATYWFDGGLDISNGSRNVTFCPGIYYIRGGNLTITAGAAVSGAGVTFVLEGDAGFSMSGGTSTSLSAPVANSSTAPTNCVQPASYPESSDLGVAPYDGTNGLGICGVLIFQDRTDTAADTVDEGAASTLNGWIYTPNATLTDSGAGVIAPTGYTSGSTSGITGNLGIVAKSVNVSGSGQLVLDETGSSSGSGSPQAILVR
jgi:hypothetical protein